MQMSSYGFASNADDDDDDGLKFNQETLAGGQVSRATDDGQSSVR